MLAGSEGIDFGSANFRWVGAASLLATERVAREGLASDAGALTESVACLGADATLFAMGVSAAGMASGCAAAVGTSGNVAFSAMGLAWLGGIMLAATACLRCPLCCPFATQITARAATATAAAAAKNFPRGLRHWTFSG